MEHQKKESAGLFRLDELESLEVEDDPLFKTSREVDSSSPAARASTDEMVELIRKARATQSEVAAPDEDLQPQESTPAEPESVPDSDDQAASDPPNMAKYLAASQGARRSFETYEMRVVLSAAENELKRRSRKKYLAIFGIAIPLFSGLIGFAIYLIVSLPPSLLEGSYPVSLPPLVFERSELATIQVEMIPEPAPTLETPRPAESRPREPSRVRTPQRRERERVDTSNLF